jgi:predicted RNase H-like HicB family nuclease
VNKLFYPAIFHREEKGFWVTFPDFPECFTEGDNMEMAYEMSVDALGLAITSRKEEEQIIPKATQVDKLNVEEGVAVVIEFDILEYYRKHNSKAVKKTLSIPEWMNEEAIAMGINFSQVLQEALMLKLGVR